MNTPSTENANIENTLAAPAKNWESPNLSNRGSETQRPRIRLEIGSSRSSERKGRQVNQFLLREEADEMAESPSTLKAKRQEFKALFEAGVNR